jgi:hypothetical protein
MGERCVSYDKEKRRATKLSAYSNDDICGACRERRRDAQVIPTATQGRQVAPVDPQPAPEEYRELFHAARVLFEAGVDEEELIIPTLAFAAYSSEKSAVAYLRHELSEVDEGGEAWEDLRQLFFLNTFNTLEPETVTDGVLVFRHVPVYVNLDPFDPRKVKTQPVEKITIDVLSRPVKAADVVRQYERALQIGEISYKRSDIGSVSYKA